MEQLVAPLRRHRNPQTRRHAEITAEELAELSVRLHARHGAVRPAAFACAEAGSGLRWAEPTPTGGPGDLPDYPNPASTS